MAIGKLTHAKIAKLNKPALLGDGGGLWLRAKLLMDTSLSKRFCFRYRKRRIYAEIPIGPFPEVSLVDARLKASGYRAAIANGEDPAADRRAKRGKAAIAPGAYTFENAVYDYYESVGRSRWKTRDTGEDWLRALRLHLLPSLGRRPIDELTDVEVQAALKPIFARSPDLGRRVSEYAKNVFDRARVIRATSHPNPFEWKSHLAYVFPPPPAVTHRPTIDWRKMPELYAALTEGGDHSVALAARFCLASALRPGETRKATFSTINETEGTFTLSVTKSGRVFVAPLSAAARVVVERCVTLRRSDYLFPGLRSNAPIHETALNESIRQLCRALFDVHATAHGVSRSCFADWAYETNAAPESVIEQALNHVYGSATVRSYKRGSQLEARRILMDKYAAFLTGAGGVVVAFPGAGSYP